MVHVKDFLSDSQKEFLSYPTSQDDNFRERKRVIFVLFWHPQASSGFPYWIGSLADSEMTQQRS